MKTLLIVMMSLVSYVASAQTQPPPARPAQAAEEQYVVGPGDVLRVKVFADNDMSRDNLPIDVDGTIEAAEIGRVAVAGKTLRQIEQHIEKEYINRKILLRPAVTVSIVEYRSRSVWVTGAVKSPQAVTMKGSLTLLTALSEADYFAQDAGFTVQIFRAKAGQPSGAAAPTTGKPDIEITRENIEAGRANNVHLQDGDTVFVPKAEQFLVSGEVNSVGQYTIRPGLTIWDAVMTIAGGPTRYAAMNRLTVQRTVNGKTTTLKPKEKQLRTEVVKPGDRIHVPRRRM
jgi:protein involved in polysaccharide export with SLBB domain